MPNDRTESNPYIRSRTQRKEEDNGKCHVDNEKWKCNQANGPLSKEERLNSAQSESRLFMKAAQTKNVSAQEWVKRKNKCARSSSLSLNRERANSVKQTGSR